LVIFGLCHIVQTFNTVSTVVCSHILSQEQGINSVPWQPLRDTWYQSGTLHLTRFLWCIRSGFLFWWTGMVSDFRAKLLTQTHRRK
jgi:hypothetical protein